MDGADVLIHRIDHVKEALPTNTLTKKKIKYVDDFKDHKFKDIKHARMYYVPQRVKKLPISTRLYGYVEKKDPKGPVSIPKWRKWNTHNGILRTKLVMELEPRVTPPAQPHETTEIQAEPHVKAPSDTSQSVKWIASLHRRNLMSKFISLWVEKLYRTVVARSQ